MGMFLHGSDHFDQICYDRPAAAKKRESQVMHICHCRVFVRLEGIYRFIDFKQQNTGGKGTSGHNDLEQV